MFTILPMFFEHIHKVRQLVQTDLRYETENGTLQSAGKTRVVNFGS